MARYKFWDGKENIYTPSGAQFTADEWRNEWPWVNAPGAKMVISTGAINGGFCAELSLMKNNYAAHINFDGMTDDEALLAIEQFEDHPPQPEQPITAMDRIAAAMEAQVMMAEDDITEDVTGEETATGDVSTYAMRSVSMNAMGAIDDGIAVQSTVDEPEHSAAFVRINTNYINGLWSENLVKVAVKKGHITKAEYQEITGKALA